MKMWLVMLAVVAMSGSIVIAADEAKHESKSTEATETTEKSDDKKLTEKSAPKVDVRERLRELIDACMAKRGDVVAKPQAPILPEPVPAKN